MLAFAAGRAAALRGARGLRVAALRPTGKPAARSRGAAARLRTRRRADAVDAEVAALDPAWPGLIDRISRNAGAPAAVRELRAAMDATGEAAPDEAYAACLPFPLDDYQIGALRELRAGRNVIVSAPTGSGKTVAGELAIAYALARGERVLYTTPLKALSNQKFEDFCRAFGPENVGLSTGDSGVRREAPVVVMTTEVFRNMLYDGAGEDELKRVFAVVFDEFHYMNDPYRGTVWEESVVSCPERTKILALSATVSNGDQVRGWMRRIHGETSVVASDFRPVPLKYEFADGAVGGLVPLFRADDVGPGSPRDAEMREKGNGGARERAKKRLRLNPVLAEAAKAAADDRQSDRRDRGRGRGGRGGRNRREQRRNDPGAMRQAEVVRDLQKRDLLPAIVFVFSRKGCEEEATYVGTALQLLDEGEEVETRRLVREWALANEDVAALPSERERLYLLTRGVAAHHAGLLPQYKQLVEDLFKRGLVKCCFATETLAAGVNLPARTTVVSSLRKRGDAGIEPLTTAALLQMAGRAGRRGKDDAGTVVLMRGRRGGAGDADLARRILLSEVAPIESHFQPSYGMACALLRRHNGSLDRCRRLVERSFGSYRAARGRGKPAASTRRRGEVVGGVDLADLETFAGLAARAGAAADAYAALAAEPSTPFKVLEREKLALRAAQRDVLASPVARLAPEDQAAALEALREARSARGESEGEAPDWREFVNIVGVLRTFGALDEDHRVTELGGLVASIKGDNELLLALALLDEATLAVAEGGTPDEFAALCSAFVSEVGSRPNAFVDYGPSPKIAAAVDALWLNVLGPLGDAQRDAGLDELAAPLTFDDAAAGLVEAWAGGVSWAALSESTSLDHGDLIRLFRRTLDVLRTTAGLDPATVPESFAPVRRAARLAAEAIDRPPVHDTTYDAVFKRDDDDDEPSEDASAGGDDASEAEAPAGSGDVVAR